MIVTGNIRVEAPPSAAFELFTAGIGGWWPLDHFSYGGSRAQTIVLEGRPGGRFYELFDDGDELEVGTVLACEPPDLIVFTWWAPGWPAAAEVEVTFTGEGAGTRVNVEHRAFERLGPEGQAIADGFAGGWPGVLGAFAAAASYHRGAAS